MRYSLRKKISSDRQHQYSVLRPWANKLWFFLRNRSSSCSMETNNASRSSNLVHEQSKLLRRNSSKIMLVDQSVGVESDARQKLRFSTNKIRQFQTLQRKLRVSNKGEYFSSITDLVSSSFSISRETACSSIRAIKFSRQSNSIFQEQFSTCTVWSTKSLLVKSESTWSKNQGYISLQTIWEVGWTFQLSPVLILPDQMVTQKLHHPSTTLIQASQISTNRLLLQSQTSCSTTTSIRMCRFMDLELRWISLVSTINRNFISSLAVETGLTVLEKELMEFSTFTTMLSWMFNFGVQQTLLLQSTKLLNLRWQAPA